MKTKRILWLWLVLISPIGYTRADMLPAGKRGVNYCARINNLDQYPNYVFLSYCQFPSPNYTIIRTGECIPFYHLSQPTICAIPKEKFNKEALKANRLEGSDRVEQKLRYYFEENPEMLRSDVRISSVSTRDESDPVSSITDVLTVKRVSADSFIVTYDNVAYGFDDGTTETKSYTTQAKRPAPSHKLKIASVWIPDTWLLVAGFVSIIGLVSVLYFRNHSR